MFSTELLDGFACVLFFDFRGAFDCLVRCVVFRFVTLPAPNAHTDTRVFRTSSSSLVALPNWWVPHQMLARKRRVWYSYLQVFCVVASQVPETTPDEAGWRLNKLHYYQEGWLAGGNTRGIVGVTFTACHCKKNFDPPTRSNFNLRGHRNEVSLNSRFSCRRKAVCTQVGEEQLLCNWIGSTHATYSYFLWGTCLYALRIVRTILFVCNSRNGPGPWKLGAYCLRDAWTKKITQCGNSVASSRTGFLCANDSPNDVCMVYDPNYAWDESTGWWNRRMGAKQWRDQWPDHADTARTRLLFWDGTRMLGIQNRRQT